MHILQKTDKKLTIAIDGFSSCGKSTMAKALAKEMNYTYVDSGAMYRAVTLYCIDNNLIDENNINEKLLEHKMGEIQIEFVLNAETRQADTFLNGKNVEEEIRQIEVSNLVSPVSKLAFVRKALVELQRKISEGKGVVMDGRDIGTVVFPDADLKIFMTADVDIRAQRRYDELISKNQKVSLQEISDNISKRDFIDSNRKESPLRQAEDAVVLDNSALNRQEQLQWILDLIALRFQS
ncbi:MAG: (d)CMP kinase [Bacteroidota bacterium]|nr:(d)CMP kinase [Bacteroidota bacterium]